MPLEHMQTVTVLPATERRQAGQALRKIVPRTMHAHWAAPPTRRDPIDLLIESGRHRIASLLPIRYDRMRASPFAIRSRSSRRSASVSPEWRTATRSTVVLFSVNQTNRPRAAMP